jgi:deazaflavin-dependent oxidoreductase (nitroreductase family)
MAYRIDGDVVFTYKIFEEKRMSGPNEQAMDKSHEEFHENASDFNKRVIDEFRANDGKVGGYFANDTLLLLTSKGAKSGKISVTPLQYYKDDDHIVIIASAAGADNNPAWYHNLLANPVTTVEVGKEAFRVRATLVTQEPERSCLYARMVERGHGFADYERKTSRKIPAVLLERID